MLFILNEKDASCIFENYRNVAAFSLSKGLKGVTLGDFEVSYEKLNFLPDEDTVNGIKSGDLKLNKVIKKAVKALHDPNMDDAAIGLGMTQLITIISSNRKNKRGPAVIVFVTNEDDPERNKIMTKYIKALLGEFGITPVTKAKVAYKIFKKRKKAKERIIAFSKRDKSGCNLSRKGVELKQLNQVFYELELRQSSMSNMELRDLDKDAADACIKTLIKVYTAENLRSVTKRTAKRLAKKDKVAVKAYGSLADILKIMDNGMKMPSVKYGQKKKKGEAVGPKMNCKKFRKFFSKKNNRGLLLLIYAHTLAVLLGLEVGAKDYNSFMKTICNNFRDGFGKEFTAAAAEYAKDEKAVG